MRSSKVLLVLMITASLIAVLGNGSLLMASTSPSHSTHFDSVKGPGLPLNEIGCCYCHTDGRLQCADGALFRNVENPEGPPLSLNDTAVCDPCHSAGCP